jgi:putative transposase
MPALAIRQDLPAAELRRLARLEPDRRAAMRLIAIANALEGLSRAEAARLAGMERQALRDAVVRYNAEGPRGLHDRPRSGRPEALTPGRQAALKAWVLRGPAPERDGVSAWRLADVRAHAERAHGVRYSEWGMARLLRRLGLSRQKARPRRPQGSAAERAAFKKWAWVDARRDRPSTPASPAAALVPGRGQGGPERAGLPPLVRARGARPPGLADKRFESLHLFAACRPGTDEALALALPEATAAGRAVLLERLAHELAPGVHAALLLDRAGWHTARRLSVPDTITLVPLPAYSPELNPVERVWLYLRERFLSHRVLDNYAAVLDAACRAWNALAAEPGRLASLAAYPYLLRSELS